MRRTLTATLALAALLGSASGAGAQSIPSPFEYLETRHSVGFFGGYLLADPGIGVNGEVVELGPQSAPTAGVRYQIRFGGPLSGEVAAAFSPTTRKVYGPSRQPDPSKQVPVEAGEADVALLLGEAGLVFHLTGDRTWHRLAPFVAGTGGVAADLAGGGAADKALLATERFEFGPSFAVGIGLGTDWYPTRRLSIRAEVRDRLWKIELPEGLRPTGEREVSEWTHNAAFTLGGAIHF